MATKASCELDPLPIDIFKKAVENEKFIQVINRIIHLSLNSGQFANAWKTAIIRPFAQEVGS